MINTVQEKINRKLKDMYSILAEDLLLKVQKPGQYLGIELGHRVAGPQDEFKNNPNLKKWEDTFVRLALVYPDLYELGMSNFGTKILYQIINSNPNYLCDRTYAPMQDMESLLREQGLPLWGWESFKPLYDFDLLGFSLSYELSYTNVLNILELSQQKVLSCERENIFPLVFAGGPAAFNPEPMADFMDFFIIGDGEEVVIEILDLIKNFKQRNQKNTKKDLLLELAQIPGVYVPAFYEPDSNENYIPKPITAIAPNKITKRVVSLGDYNQPTFSPIPYLSSVQDRQVLEIRRGCDRGCRFCQPGYVYLPVRERTPDDLVRLSTEALKNSGYDEYSLLSLSASDYTCLQETAVKLNSTHSPKGISLSMPSQRADRFSMEIANELNTVRKSGITLAPEAGTERLREVINKGLKEFEIRRAIENVYDGGFRQVKLYFMIGLPTEAKDDLDGIIDLLKWASDLSKIKNKRPLDITCTISTFVPKAFTPFQWFSQNSQIEFQEKIDYLKQQIKDKKLRTVKLNCTDPKIALLEAVMSRGDRRISKLIHKAYQDGAKFDAWDDQLNMDIWYKAGKELDIDLKYEAVKAREVGSVSPWDVIDTGLLNKFLVEEYNNAVAVVETAPCTENKCHACGVCFELDVLNEVTIDKSQNNKFVKVINGSQNMVEALHVTPPLGDCYVSAPLTRNDVKNPTAKNNLPSTSVQKFEIIHSKASDLRFISHLDVQRAFERAMRRADLPISFTEGFNPKPKFQWLMPLPIYYESEYELMHLEFSDYVNESDLHVMLNRQLPEEFQIKSLKGIDLNQKLPKPENIKVLYQILTSKPILWEKYICELNEVIQNFLTQSSLTVEIPIRDKDKKVQGHKTFKYIDVRSSVESIRISNQKPLELEFLLIGSARPEVILNYLESKVLKLKENVLESKSGWQLNWKITKQNVLVGAKV